MVDVAPVMSFPAILRNSALNSRFAHLQEDNHDKPKVPVKPQSTERERGGKRRIRRRENARFSFNPHIVPPTSLDYIVTRQCPERAFPQPLCKYLKRDETVPPSVPAVPNPGCSNAGHFTFGLKGARKSLRRAGPRAEDLVLQVEDEIRTWLENGAVVLFSRSGEIINGAPMSSLNPDGPIREVNRTPSELIWDIDNDPFARYVVHCVCRWHSIVSFSKPAGMDSSARRLTHILRPHVTRPHPLGSSMIETPPATDLDSASSGAAFDSQDSDFASSVQGSGETLSDIDSNDEGVLEPLSSSITQDLTEEVHSETPSLPLDGVSFILVDPSNSPVTPRRPLWYPETTTEMVAGMGRLSLREDSRATSRPQNPSSRQALPSIGWMRMRSSRSDSSPSRSPSVRRRAPVRSSRRLALYRGAQRLPIGIDCGRATENKRPESFWAYVFA